ncbi:hypothetical protein E2C01_045370 [Portunus trituberculatus]|uniref:Uncharacterized protein n=1 Tax=Portunus trituberculatus TaxID=210409 RepID=A0A5B7FY59_PORTR|nr:hypothetical protein [Portunus trituberculatus]
MVVVLSSDQTRDFRAERKATSVRQRRPITIDRRTERRTVEITAIYYSTSYHDCTVQLSTAMPAGSARICVGKAKDLHQGFGQLRT